MLFGGGRQVGGLSPKLQMDHDLPSNRLKACPLTRIQSSRRPIQHCDHAGHGPGREAYRKTRKPAPSVRQLGLGIAQFDPVVDADSDPRDHRQNRSNELRRASGMSGWDPAKTLFQHYYSCRSNADLSRQVGELIQCATGSEGGVHHEVNSNLRSSGWSPGKVCSERPTHRQSAQVAPRLPVFQ